MATRQLNIRLDENLDRRLGALAERTGRTKAFYAGAAIEGFLDDWEDYFLAKDALAEFLEGNDAAQDVDSIDWDGLGR
ncbi:MAG: TraY domain-containing protein [Bifidobacteriaceae bacterium]|nr:TraY domain-containing protein [Bifidobacteriaceae bacterium]